MMIGFFQKLETLAKQKNTLLCVGLDPRLSPQEGQSVADLIFEANQALIDQTLEFTLAYKPNIAFYEAWGRAGLVGLEKTLQYIGGRVPVILDAKRGDIGPTAEAYAQGTFDTLGADAVTLAPYMGKDSVEPFLKYRDKGVFVLARTSNPSSKEVQDLVGTNGQPYYQTLTRMILGWGPHIGLVVAGNDLTALKLLRKTAPQSWFLSPGIGAQGGSIYEAVKAGMRADGLGILPVVAREISGAASPGDKARELRDALNTARQQVMEQRELHKKLGGPGVRSGRDGKLKTKVLKGLIKTACFKLGDFVLKSGLRSPFYVDMRRIQSDPKVLAQVAQAYAELLKPLKFDRIAGIPVAALPLATAVSLELGVPLIYPRIPPKAHGTGNPIEGEYQSGERVALLDDLITTGKSKEEAIQVLRDAGLVVEDLVVLLERGTSGRQDMAQRGVRLHAYSQIEEFLPVCQELGLIDKEKRKELESFAKES